MKTERRHIQIPDFDKMTQIEIEGWLATLSAASVYANFPQLNRAVMERFGSNARITTSTHAAPKIIEMVTDV